MRRVSYLIVFCAGLSGCAVGPDFHQPNAPQIKSYTESAMPAQTVGVAVPGAGSQRFLPGQDISAQWWQVFHSQDLNQLIEAGLKNSPNLQAAQAALRQAQENLRAEAGSVFLPTVTGGFNGARQRGSTASIDSPTPNSVFNLYNASVNVSYKFDIFGGNRRQVEYLRAQVDNQYFELQAAYLTLTANIVTTAVTEAALRAQITATQELVNAADNQLRIMKKQLNLGGVSAADVLAQTTLLAQTQAMLPPLLKNLAQTRDALAVLIGELPGAVKLPQFDLDTIKLPAELPVSLPSALVQQRPDIRAAEALLHAASAQIGISTANMLPQFILTSSYGGQSISFGSLFNGSNNIWNLQGQVLQTIFNGGALIAKRKSVIAGYDQAAAQYRQTVLQAFQNVADTLQALDIDAKALMAYRNAEVAAKQTLAITKKQLQLGGVSYLALLNAQIQYQQAHINRIQAQALRYSDTAALFQALGGGWWNRDQV